MKGGEAVKPNTRETRPIKTNESMQSERLQYREEGERETRRLKRRSEGKKDDETIKRGVEMMRRTERYKRKERKEEREYKINAREESGKFK